MSKGVSTRLGCAFVPFRTLAVGRDAAIVCGINLLWQQEMRGSNGGVSNSLWRLSYGTNEPVVKDAFGQHGEIIEGNVDTIKLKVICDHKSGKSKGYGFVQFNSESAARNALKAMDGQLLDGWNIRVQYANKG
ncbi:hypothetical protein FNV43_RR04277 [Rhamnella rubrinervis]|uniref:RRM domain-containing protein n=1 Tax=Rhamnella rubrinervis TaxID=2594499 RepID=A0A8K0HJX4_9ROSA|nr:hypothetical protein FNV43_RR04277 [Rhamnella rubrinervis]